MSWTSYFLSYKRKWKDFS